MVTGPDLTHFKKFLWRSNMLFQLDKLRVENEQLRRAIEENGMTISREPDPSDLGKCDD